MRSPREDALEIARKAIDAVLPENALRRALEGRLFPGKVVLVAIGKAAWRMAKAAADVLGDRILRGVVITKYGHSQGPIGNFEIYEAGHPIPDENTVIATEAALQATAGLSRDDVVLFLVSGGGSALFEKPKGGVSLKSIMDVTDQLLRSGANIVEINAIRKRLSAVKGGQFAQNLHPAKVYAVVLSDVLSDRLDSIASGPAYPDSTTSEEALRIVQKYGLKLDTELLKLLEEETPKSLSNVETAVIGSVKVMCEEAAKAASELGYNTKILTTTLDCEAREAGLFLAAIAREEKGYDRPLPHPCALILGGETVVHVRGRGLGGRNQELALSAAMGIQGLEGVAVLSVGSDGTDGPTDAAGGIVDGSTITKLKEAGCDPEEALKNNDSYHALEICGSLIKTGPTGTNVNDLTVLVCQ
ncbi:MAG TPA: glycerate kinase [Synergistaceae bacterium]|nr:glycerate kinase [Synergistaceae bacterium]